MRDKITLLYGDCLALMPNLEDGSVPLLIADPPYGIGYHSNHYKDKNPHAPVANDWNFQPGTFFRECERVLKDGGAMYLFCRWDVTPLWLPYFSGLGLKVKTVIAWVKDNWSAGDLEGCFGNQYEHIIFVTKGRHKLRGRRWSNVWEFPRVSHTKMLHPTQKPVPLLKRAILSSSDPGDLVIDPFAGSGSTGEACQQTDRRVWMTDVDPRMILVAARRLGIRVDLDILPIQDDASPLPHLAYPDPAEWGIHPEDLRAVMDQIANNIREAELPLFDSLP